MTTRPARIAIIGTGPGGLTCARILQQAGIEVTVYERDPGPDARDQGGTLDMQRETGQAALDRAALADTFLAQARPEGQDMLILDQHGTVHQRHIAADGDQDAPEMDRADLRALLVASVEPGTIRWGATLTGAEPLGAGRHRVTFGDGTSIETELLVGADGAWSRVRPLVSPHQPRYEGVVFVEIGFGDVDRRHPEVAALVGRGGMFALGENRGLIAQRQARERIRAYVALRDDLDWAERGGVDLADPAAVRAFLLARFEGWAPALRRLLQECDDQFIVRPIYALPVPHRWNTRAGVTLVGDAAHLMSPFSGLGANTAMLDGADLATAIIEAGGVTELRVTDALAAYEAIMLPRAAQDAAGAHEGLTSAITAHPEFDQEASEAARTVASRSR
jgi:2-polyprenyl-6-methoxyphenol hydroxylase-like FAD-dependent oxidoreductase